MSRRKCHRICEICGVREAHLKSPRFFANFPLDEQRCREWVQVTGNEDLVHLPIKKLNKMKYVCVEHFKKTQINKKNNRLKKHAVPCINLNSKPLSDDLMAEFPLHCYKSQVSQFQENTTSSADKEDICSHEIAQEIPEIERPFTTYVTTSDINETETKSANRNVNTDKVLSSDARPFTTTETQVSEATANSRNEAVASGSQERQSIQNTSNETCVVSTRAENTVVKDIKRKPTTNKEFTTREIKLMEKLEKTKNALKTLRRRAILFDRIQSPVLRDFVINLCKNERRKPNARRWTTNHKLSCLAILKQSHATYRYLSETMALPSIKTLQNILKNVPTNLESVNQC